MFCRNTEIMLGVQKDSFSNFKLSIDAKLHHFCELSQTDARASVPNDCSSMDYLDVNIL